MTNQNEGWDTIEVPSKDEDNKIEFEVESEEEKPIEAVEEQLKEETSKLQQLESYKDNDKSPIKMEIEKVVDKWNLTLPSCNIMKGLNSLKDCSILIIEKYQKAQLQNRPFYLFGILRH